MADKTLQLVLDALSQAVAEPDGRPLHGNKTTPGLFPSTGPAKQAAQKCKDEGYLQVVRTESKGKAVQEFCTITEKGIAFLLSQVSPKQVLEEFVRAVEARGEQVGKLIEAARLCQSTFDALKTQVAKVLSQVKPGGMGAAPVAANGNQAWKSGALTFLSQWSTNHPNEDCPLAELYRSAKQAAPSLTVGQFHDGLRQLHDQGQVYLHPWTGPLYEIPQPAIALLVGHAVAYYASRRNQ